MLRGKDRMPLNGLYMPAPGDIRPTTHYCSDMTIDEARTLAKALDDAGPKDRGGAFRLSYRFEASAQGQEDVPIYFEPYLPHGEFICSACG
jgi:hypothetical protein